MRAQCYVGELARVVPRGLACRLDGLLPDADFQLLAASWPIHEAKIPVLQSIYRKVDEKRIGRLTRYNEAHPRLDP